MNVEPTPAGKATVYTTSDTPAGATTAERYVAEELTKARASLQRNRIVGLIALVLIGGYMMYLTNGFTSNLEPHAAAEVAEGFVAQQVSDKGPEVAEQVKQKIPELIQQIPDYAMKQLPGYRESIENKVETDLTKYCQDTAPKLNKDLDTFIGAHKDQVKQMLANGDDPSAVKQMGEEMKATMHEYLQEKPDGGEAASEQIDKSLSSMKQIEATMHHLAENKGLTAEEQKTRRAIAVLSHAIERQTGAVKEQMQSAMPAAADAATPPPSTDAATPPPAQ